MTFSLGIGARRWAAAGLATLVVAVLMLVALDRLDRAFPPPLEVATEISREVVDRDGGLLRAYTTASGRWRLPVSLDAVDPDYIRMLIAYEDRRFRTHGGVDPAALARAGVQFVVNGGHIVSGG